MFHKYWLKSRDRDQIYLERSDLKEGSFVKIPVMTDRFLVLEAHF